ncbi:MULTISPECIES: LysE family translocator [unclassified Neptuniibacter]|jgi:threonine/homoserine/homoserine lactone efflux protein|uniref:LysE family translocator n=1 Tax=unclassified Neptuniibacter TaxID=2630693 RepID=UPI0026E3835D|nr:MULTISPECIES: LysE family translocator [unclassified Neptuniibacter]MDO6513420.1 LysE family translocator [Neptuniibacter sp. 2_MG-2023]MDO6593949.1 LysE family translocator [Neptuniibacter sp. 1_MG-2023]
MTLESALSFFVAVFIFSITPGPGIFAILARALTKGAPACLMLALGMTISDILYLVAACYGLAVIATHWSELFTFIRILGACYLLYLGWKMWHAPLDLTEANGEKQSEGIMGFIQGFLISASNPKVILFYIAFLPTFMDLTALDNMDIALASFLTLVSLMSGLMLIALFASKARRWFKSEKAVNRLNKSAGSIMAGAGLFLITRH